MRTRTSFGFSRESTSQPRFHFSSAPGRKFSTTMCERAASRRTISCPSARRRSQLTERLLRDCTCHHSDTPFLMRRHLRSGSPSPGGSILITSAPKSASVFAQNGPATRLPSSSTFTPASGPEKELGSDPIYYSSCLLFFQQPKRVVLQNDLGALIDHLVREAHQAALAARGETLLEHLGFDVDRVAHHGGRLDVEGRIEECES